jgi:hypothetical protein
MKSQTIDDFDSFLESENEKLVSMLESLKDVKEDDVNTALQRFSKILGLDYKKLSVKFEKPFESKPTLSAYQRSNNTIIINPKCKDSKDLVFFCLAHELRHVWQYENYGDEVFMNHNSHLSIDSDKYNKQIVEIDANAFALAAMDSLYKCWDIRIKIKCNSADVRKDVLQTDGVSERYEELMEQYFS